MTTQTKQFYTAEQVKFGKLSSQSKIKGKFDIVFDSLEGKILNNRYKVLKYLDKGENGEVFEAVDLNKEASQQKPLVIKVQETTDLFHKEINYMINVQRMCKNNRAKANGKTPQIKDHGQFIMIDS